MYILSEFFIQGMFRTIKVIRMRIKNVLMLSENLVQLHFDFEIYRKFFDFLADWT